MELIVSLGVAVAWPAAVVWVAIIFKNEIRLFLSRISQLKYKDLESSFDKVS